MVDIAPLQDINPSFALLTTKLYAPRPRANFVARPRLITRLNRGWTQRRLTLISAPTGYGKSTLIGEWLAQRQWPVAWLSVDQTDNDPARFWSYCIAALQTVQPDLGSTSLDLLHSTQTFLLENILAPLVNDIATVPADFVFVLDDYHLVEAPVIHQAMSFLLDNLPPPLHLVILSRSDPFLPLAHLRARGQLLELRAADLRFTPGETAEFLNQVMGLNLSTAEVNTLETRTEGWVAGLQLAALSLQGRDTPDVPGLIAAFSGSNRYILDYLAEAMLQRQPEYIQNFLLQTSILDRLCGPLCDAVLSGGAGEPEVREENSLSPLPPCSPVSGQETLEYLERANLFIIPLDDERRWYRYHHLFADLLRSLLQRRLEVGHVATLHRRAADWYEQYGLVADAMSHALAIADAGRAARLVERHAQTLLSRTEMTTLLSWLNALPDEVVRTKPQLSLFEAWALVLTGQLEAVEPRLREVEQDHELTGERAAIRGTAAYFRRDYRQAIELFHQALEYLPPDNLFLRGAVALSLGVAYSWSGDVVNAGQALVEAITTNQAVGNWHVALSAMWNLAQLQVAQGRLQLATELCRQALNLVDVQAKETGQPPIPAAGGVYISMGSLLYERNDLEGAERHLLEGIRLSEQGAELGILIVGYSTLAWIKQAQGEGQAALGVLQRAEQFVQGNPDSVYWAAQLADHRAWLWLVQGNIEAAQRWAQHYQPYQGDRLSYLREIGQTTLARLIIAQASAEDSAPGGRLDKAIDLLTSLRHSSLETGRKGHLIEILTLLALAYQVQGNEGQAIEVLGQALSLAEPEDYLRLFLDQGQALVILLRQEAVRGIASAYVDKLLTAFAESANITQGKPQLPPSLLIEPLSERELEILRLMAAGMSNQEIAEKVIVTVGTVKWHLNNIYGKLDVRSRTQALARAREFGLL